MRVRWRRLAYVGERRLTALAIVVAALSGDSCSQNRRTRQPKAFKRESVSRSRRMLA